MRIRHSAAMLALALCALLCGSCAHKSGHHRHRATHSTEQSCPAQYQAHGDSL